MSIQDKEVGRPLTSSQINGKKDASPGVVSGIFQITTPASKFQRLVNTLGTPKDTPELREKLQETRLHDGQSVKETSAKFKQASKADYHAGVGVIRNGSNNLNIRSFGFKMYILEPYFQKYESFIASNFQDYIADELLHCSSKLLLDFPNDFLRLSVLNRQLIGEGSHRHLYSSIKLHIQSESIPQIPNSPFVRLLFERLPFGVFADPFELQHLHQRGVFTDVAVFGDTNLELPAFASNQSVVEVHMNISSNILFGQRNELEISIDLPLHARYPAMDESGYSKIEFDTPDLLMSCNIEGNLTNQRCLLPASLVRVESNAGTVTWRIIPSGTRGHAGMVSVFTFFATFISTLVIVRTSMSSSYINRTKTFKLS